jgi:serine/threonine protein kinase
LRPDRWQRVEALFADLVEQPSAARARLLETLPPEDQDLREELSSLLANDCLGRPLEQIIHSMAVSALSSTEAEGGRLGSYRIVRKLGEGGMRTVFLAVRADDEYQQQVAIKVVTQGRETLQSVERFRRERQILASLEHPYIARLLDGGSGRIEGFAKDTPYLVMELVEGEPVTDYCLRNHLDVKGRLDLFLKICEAVAYAHRKLVAHRDLKPSNILITAEGSPRLLDFGIAKLLTEDGTGDLTAVAGLAMTPDFASPEQVLQTQITTASDIYSLGAILYLLLTGVKPHCFENLTPFEVRKVVCDTEPQEMAVAAPQLRSQLQGDLEAIVSMAMRKEPEHRYSSVEQLSADLLRHLQGWPVTARQGNFKYRAGKYLRRNRTAITAGVFIACALGVGTTAATIEAVRASQARAEREREGAVISQALAEARGRDARQQAQEALRQREYADVERAEAETQRHAPERRFEQVHQLAGTFLLDFHYAIAKLPGGFA